MNIEVKYVMASPKFILLFVITLFAVSACGGGGGGGPSAPATLTGTFVDDPVSGMRYVSGNISGDTDTNGKFKYTSGSTVRFYVGDILLGETLGKSFVTPVDLVPGGLVTTNAVTNIARFLQTIDDDGTPNNGLLITQVVSNLAVGQSINFNQSPAAFDADGNVQVLVSTLTGATSAGARPLVLDTDAQNQLSQNIWSYYTGNYQGTFNGSSTGTLNFQVSFADGSITGTGSTGAGSFAIIGNLQTNASFTLSTSGQGLGGATFFGRISPGRSISGTWTNGQQSGQFSGQYSIP